MRWFPIFLVMVVVLAGCASPDSDAAGESLGGIDTENTSDDDFDGSAERFGDPPTSPSGDLSPQVQEAVAGLFRRVEGQRPYRDEEREHLQTIADSQDPRLAWLLSDLLRISGGSASFGGISTTAGALVDLELEASGSSWGELTSHLIAWDVPAPPDYLEFKRNIYIDIVPEWEPLFEDGREVDWRHVSWGGVGIDDRPFGATEDPCTCIPAADNPDVTTAAEASWLDDDAIVFGVEIDGETRAYPRQIMEVREMVNDTLGGRDFAMPYCTLCGAAQVYFTDNLPAGVARPVMRTSGLLIRSNKVMYDLASGSVFDTFLGAAVTGPLADQDIVLDQNNVVTARWGDWKAEHPDTTVLVESLANGQDFDFRNGRDASGPIFPVGEVDGRLDVHTDVLGVVSPSGTPIAFPVVEAERALAAGEEVAFDGVELKLDSGGLTTVDPTLGAHQAFWFAWSQFYGDAHVWSP